MNTKHKGLSAEAVMLNRTRFGVNSLETGRDHTFLKIALEIISEPLFIILVCAAIIYFLLHEVNEGLIMLVALCFVSGISLFQENKSHKAVNALRKLSAPRANVIREGIKTQIDAAEIVIDDIIVVEDGQVIPADAVVLETHDFTVNESILTGESLAVTKNGSAGDNAIFSGTLVTSGSCIAQVTATGKNTALGKIGRSLAEIKVPKTPLQLQIRRFVRSLVGAGAVAFGIVWLINYYLSGSILHSLLHGLTLAMSILPEEIPVAFSTFMALGAYRLHKIRVIARSPHTVETLGTATVICADKTGTLTSNEMRLAATYRLEGDTTNDYTHQPGEMDEVLEFAMWASEVNPFDSMEHAIHEAYSQAAPFDKRLRYKMVHEYPLGGKPPMMTHVFEDENKNRIIAVKGGVETIVDHSLLKPEERLKVMKRSDSFALKGYRVLGVGRAMVKRPLPLTQEEFRFEFLGLVAFYDPPKQNIAETLNKFYSAGINVKMITGDHAGTAQAIAEQIHLRNSAAVMSGAEVEALSLPDLRKKVQETNVFARMFPEAKLKVIEALKANGEVVAMTGDGVNDGPALKAAHIGIAMGHRGSELAKKAASLILIDDNLDNMTDAVALGRRIYQNLKKAILYIISIHVPIILIVMLPLVLFWEFTDIFSPVHVIFLELIMGPTCSIAFEREPIEKNIMQIPPRKITYSFFSIRELFLSILQGLVITAACLMPGYYFMRAGMDEKMVRSVIYATLIFSNLFLTLSNRSLTYSVFTTIRYRNPLLPVILLISLAVLFLSLYFAPAQNLFGLAPLPASNLVVCLISAFGAVMWIEIYKLFKRKKAAQLPK